VTGTLLMLLLAAIAAATPAATPATPATPATATLDDVRFMAGHWVGDAAGGALSEEVWTEPAGDCMVGMWRMVAEGKLKVAEILTLRLEEGGPVMRLRHFHADGTAWEDKDEPMVLRLVAHAPGKAAFEGPHRDGGSMRITYERDGAALVSTLERGGRVDRFRFRAK
jgi:hypothetical protein